MKKTYIIRWRGTSHYKQVLAETVVKAKIKYAQSENVNPLLTADRMEVVRSRFINPSLIVETL